MSNIKEIWKDINGYENSYQISNFGKVKSLSREQSRTERILKGEKDKRGYVRVRLSLNNKTKKFQVHRLVAESFINNKYNKPQINHIDGNPSNNNSNNLEWCTQSENMKHAFRTGLQSLNGEKNTQAKLKYEDVFKIRVLLKSGMFHREIAKMFNVSRKCITDINNGKTWSL